MSKEKQYTVEQLEVLHKEIEEIAQYYNFGFEPSTSQVEVIEAMLNPNYKEVVLVAGRGWGKDLTIGMYLFHLCSTQKNMRVLFICPWNRQISNFVDQVMLGVNDDNGLPFIPNGHPDAKPIFEVVRSPYIKIKFPETNSEIIGVSAENPNGIRSFRGNVIVLNEVADIPFSTIETHVYPVIKKQSKKGKKPPKIIYIGTPKGKNHLYKKFVEGLHKPTKSTQKWYDKARLKGDTISFHQTYLDNEMSSMDLSLIKPTMSQQRFDQEIMAMFLDDSEVFIGLQEAYYTVDLGTDDTFAVINKWGEPPKVETKDGKNTRPGNRYVAGLDLAKEKDWTVLTIIDCETGKIAYWERFNGLDYFIQAERVLAKLKEYGSAPLLFDCTGVGSGVSDILFNLNKNPDQALQGKTFTNDSKADMIERLKIRIQRDKEWVPAIPILQSELQALKVTRTAMGKPSYQAPEGQHDDCVMSLALANLLYMEEVENPMVISTLG